MKKLGQGIAFKSISVIVLLLVLFSGTVSYIGYEVFTKAVLNQYAETAFRIADAAALEVNADLMEEYLELGERSTAYRAALKELDQLCNAFDTTFIYVIQPDLRDYAHITFVFSTVNRTDTRYAPYEVGHVVETTNDDYKVLYRALYEGELDHAMLLLQSRDYSQSLHHITAMTALKGADGKTKAILCIQRPMSVLVSIRHDYERNVFLALGVLTLLVIIGEGVFLRRSLIQPITQIADEAERFAGENATIGKKLTASIQSGDEIGVLAASIDRMEEQIVSYVENLTRVTAEQERISAELDIAKRIQESMLPRVFPPFPEKKEFEIYAAMRPAREVGGDFYDFFLIDEDHLALVIADVSGKGVPAALFMAIAKKLIKNRTLAGDSPERTLYKVNNELCDGNEQDMFVTVWLAVLELSTGKGVAANAGHEHPAVQRKSGGFALSKYRHSLAVAAMENIRFREHDFALQPGDCLFVYTDGVPEATNAQDVLFGTDRMLEALNRHPDAGPEELVREVQRSIDLFVGEAPQFDDITMLCLRYLGPENKDPA